MLIFISTIVAVLLELTVSQSYTNSGYGNNQYCTKTAYFWRYPERDPVINNLMTVALNGRTCNAVHVNIVSRHGARYTSLQYMRSFSKLQQKLKDKFTNQKYDFINKWINNYPEGKVDMLSALGEREMFYLGSFYGKEFHDLLNETVLTGGHMNSLKFAATSRVRTQDSADWFFKGLTNVLLGKNMTNLKQEIRDDILLFFHNCKRHEQDIAHVDELTKFENGPMFQTVIQEMRHRLGTNASLSVDEVQLIYRLCATELAIRNNADWCTLQTDNDREILEYANDIEDYYRHSYGHAATGQMSCPLGRDIFTAMDNVIQAHDNRSSYTKGVFQFGHSDTVLDFASGLGLFKDKDSLRADNYEAMQNRTFRASILDTFSTHLAFILYSCGGTGAENYALRLLFNGEPLSIPNCNSDICSYKQVRLGYKHFIDDCDWNNICAENQNHNPSIIG